MNNKWSNYGLWISVISLITLLMGNYGLYNLIGMDSATFKTMLDIVLTILISLGIVSNPSIGNGFKDGEK